MTVIDTMDAATQRGRVLSHLLAHLRVPLTGRQIREELHVERAQARLSELRDEGWDIRGGLDGMPLGADGTQQYMLASPVRGTPRIKVMGVTVTQDAGRGVVARVHGQLGAGMTQTYSDHDLEALRQALLDVAEAWAEERAHHLKGPAGEDLGAPAEYEEVDVDAILDRVLGPSEPPQEPRHDPGPTVDEDEDFAALLDRLVG